VIPIFFEAAVLASFFHMIESVYDETSCIWPIDFVNLFAAIIRHGRSSAKTAFAFQAHGGQFLVLDDSKDMALLTLSFNESNAAGNLFKNIAKFVEKFD